MSLEINFKKMATALALLLNGLFFAGCQKEVPLLTPAQAQAQVDSVVVVQTKMLLRQADTDLDRRRSIEVKPLTDSFLRQKTTPSR